MIYITIGGVTMPRTKKVEVGGELECNEAKMASGKLVRDVIGWRPKISASWEWVPAETLAQVVAIARDGGYVEVSYPDADGSEASGMFAIEIGNQKIFKFNGTVPMWYNVELEAKAQEVIRNG